MASELKVDTIKHTNNTSAITLDTSGNVTLAGSANNLGTVSAGTIGSSVSMPSGSIIKSGQLLFDLASSHVSTSSASYVDSGFAGTITTIKSSSDTRLEIYFYSGMMFGASDVEGESTMTLTSSSNTTYAEANDLLDSVTSYRNKIATKGGTEPHLIPYHYNTSQTSPNAYPANLTSYSAGDTLYWRVFFKKTVGSNPYYVAHQQSHVTAHYYEIMK